MLHFDASIFTTWCRWDLVSAGLVATTPPALYAGSLVGVVSLGSALLAYSVLWPGLGLQGRRFSHALPNLWLSLLFCIGQCIHPSSPTLSSGPVSGWGGGGSATPCPTSG